MPYYAGSAGNVPAARLAARLTALAPGLDRVYYSSSGSEANEKAIKMLRLKSLVEGRPGRDVILYRDRDYHGPTYGAMSCSGQSERTSGYGPLLAGFVRVPHCLCYRCHFGERYPACEVKCARAIGDIIEGIGPDRVVGGIFETITAGGGIIVPVPEYYEIVSEIFKRRSVALVLDEVVCGLGRTGTMFAYEGFGITPDVATLAKGLASAYMPISVTAVSGALFDALQSGEGSLDYFRDISTFGGSAAAAAAALANLEIIGRENLLARVRELGEFLLEGLRENLAHPSVGDVRGRGLLVGLELVADKKTKAPLDEAEVIKVVAAAAKRGVLVGRTNRCLPGLNTVVNLAPAYVATRGDLEIILRALGEAIREVLGPSG
jgi:taurine-pyruvate aminotransferase